MTRDTGATEAELLEQLCGNVLRLLTDTPVPPRSVRMRAGEVSVELDLADREPAPGAEPVAVPAPEPEGQGGQYLTAQTVGVFYHAPEPGAEPFVREGDTVTAGQQVGIIEAMKLMIPVEADQAGRIIEVLKADGEAVEYGDRLFAIETV
jgi:acetyl-CoA carboxylase biotin carboxyl carrier protein